MSGNVAPLSLSLSRVLRRHIATGCRRLSFPCFFPRLLAIIDQRTIGITIIMILNEWIIRQECTLPYLIIYNRVSYGSIVVVVVASLAVVGSVGFKEISIHFIQEYRHSTGLECRCRRRSVNYLEIALSLSRSLTHSAVLTHKRYNNNMYVSKLEGSGL